LPCDGNRTQAARVLGLSVRTLRNKIRVYIAEGIEVPAHLE
jgi:DNA-binding protein Fis